MIRQQECKLQMALIPDPNVLAISSSHKP